MDSKPPLRFPILHGPMARRVLFRSFLLASALSIIPLVQILSGPYLKMLAPNISGDCAVHLGELTANFTPSWYVFQGRHLNPIWSSIEPTQCKEYVNLTVNVVRELRSKQLLSSGGKALCIGEASALAVKALRDLGFSDAYDVDEHRFFSLKRRQFVYEIAYEDKSFDFVYSRDLDMVSVPALLVLEIERVLKPGGIGAVLVGTSGATPNSLIRSATPISSVLKTSTIVHVNRIDNLTLVAFKKRIENAGYFERYRLPADCPSLTNNRPFIEQMEPLVKEKPIDFEKKFSYLPKFVDLSTKKRLVYVDIGAGKHLNSNVTSWFLPFYPIDRRAFNVYFVDHNTSVLLSYVKKPGITFVYHPGLSGTKDSLSIDGDMEPYLGNTGFDFLAWFKETLQFADFVVLKMNAGRVELKFLSELFESGAICYVDELFLHCPGFIDGEGTSPVDCMDLFRDLRNSGVFVHQWWGDNNPTGVW
ncbi:Methyltransferase type [Trema orientale]|uniref:Methyltransferase type n=1 Tax=Trema orientale TaxID=63057 RepID=A0A2P5FV36_TREOI|nr:Methyltransferase type [Trema orientale]